MISICIPIFNFNVTNLVSALENEIRRKKLNVNIVLIDDCSNHDFKKINLDTCKNHQYIQLNKNIGRAKIRNLFLKHSNSDYFLFLDCDSLIVSKNFISNYLNSIKDSSNKVVCGGRIYDPKKPKRNKRLSWKYGIEVESKSCQERQLNPNKSFMTNNFLIKREVLGLIKFDERLSKYGHEDTLFGYFLNQHNIKIKHINNAILNGDIEDNETFLSKTELGIANLVSILHYIDYDKAFINDVALLSVYFKLKKMRLIFIVSIIFKISKPILKFKLKKGFINLSEFNLYKLGVLIQGNHTFNKN